MTQQLDLVLRKMERSNHTKIFSRRIVESFGGAKCGENRNLALTSSYNPFRIGFSRIFSVCDNAVQPKFVNNFLNRWNEVLSSLKHLRRRGMLGSEQGHQSLEMHTVCVPHFRVAT